MRRDRQLQAGRGGQQQQPPAHHVELPQQLRQARLSPGCGWVQCTILCLCETSENEAASRHVTARCWQILTHFTRLLPNSVRVSPPWSGRHKNLIYLRFLCFQESPRSGQINSTTCIIRNQPGSQESTLIMMHRVSGIPAQNLSFTPRQPRGKNLTDKTLKIDHRAWTFRPTADVEIYIFPPNLTDLGRYFFLKTSLILL